MSVVPLMFRDWWDDFGESPFRSSRLLDQQFGTGLRRDDLMSSFWNTTPSVLRSGYVRPWGNRNLQRQESGSTVNFDKEKFQVSAKHYINITFVFLLWIIFCSMRVIFGENFIFEFLNDFQIYSFDAMLFISNQKLSDSPHHLQVILDVQQFTPNEITVKTTEKHIIVEGKHEEKADEHGFISRHFVRRYQLPREFFL